MRDGEIRSATTVPLNGSRKNPSAVQTGHGTGSPEPAGAPAAQARDGTATNGKRHWDLEQLTHVAGGGAVLVDAGGAVLLRSSGAENLLGDPADFEAAWRQVHERVEKELGERPSSDNEISLEVLYGSAPEGLRLFMRVLRTGAARRGGYLAIFTRRRSLDGLQADLLLASQMRRLHTTYRQAAHDLRAPLNAIALNLDLIQQDVADDGGGREARQEALERIGVVRREVTRLSRMLAVLLAQSGTPRHSTRVFGLRRLLREVVELVAPQTGRLGIRIALAVPGERVTVLASRDHLKQAILNLLMNAIEAMPRGGPLEIELGSEGTRAVVVVRDHGVGMPARHLDRIFNMHFTTKPDGSGIGLFTTRSAIESMGGSLVLRSTEGVGTTARIELPMSVLDAAQEVSCSTS